MKHLIYMALALLCFHLPALAQVVDSTGMPRVSYSVPVEYTIGGITVSNVKYLDPDLLVPLSGLRVGQKVTIPGDDIGKAIRKMWEQGLFTNVEIRIVKTLGLNVFLDIKVTERPRLSRFSFVGKVKKGEQDELRDKIKLIGGRVLTENAKSNTVTIIKNHYKDKGFLNAKVTLVERPDTILVNSIVLEIRIDKGAKVKIGSIQFEGNVVASDATLRKKMKDTKEKVHLSIGEIVSLKNIQEATPDTSSFMEILENLAPSRTIDYLADKARLNIFSASKFKIKDYRADKEKLVQYYHSLGYRDAEILSDSVYMENGELQIRIKVNEGNRYYFRNITWKGNTMYNSDSLARILDIHKGDIYNRTLLDERLNMSPNGNDIASLYMDNGYLFFQVTPLEVAVENDSIDIEIRISEGPIAIINEVRIVGNTKTKEYVIRCELYTRPGAVFSRSDLIRSQREIINLGYFNPEQLEVVPIPNPANGTVDIEYRVVEKPSDQLELSAGWGGKGRGVVGTLGVSFTNFSLQNMFKRGAWSPLPAGDGQRLSLRVQTNGKIFQSYNFSFTEPWLGGRKPNSFTVSYYNSRFANLDSDRKVVASLITNGASIGIGTRLKWPDDYFTFQALINFQNYNLTNWTSSNFIITDGRSNNLNLKFVLARSSVYNPTYPTQGSNISLSLQVTPPYSLFNDRDYSTLGNNEKYKWVEYHKWRFKAEWFTPVTKNMKQPLVLRVAAKFGFLGYYNSQIGYSPFERFELGGDGISNIQFFGRDIVALRGYEVLSPSTGAPFFNKFTVEMRFPISLNPSATIFATAFVEGGNYYMNIRDYNPFDIKRTAGLGVRIMLPMFGLLGFDYGIGFDKDAGSGTGFGDFLNRYGKFSIVLGFEPD
ncbi:POTRA domain-containing protein [soil metagenome]